MSKPTRSRSPRIVLGKAIRKSTRREIQKNSRGSKVEWDGLMRITVPKDSVQEIKFLIQDGDKDSIAEVSLVVARESAGEGLVETCIEAVIFKPLPNGDEKSGSSKFYVYTRDEELYGQDDEEETHSETGG